MHGTNLLVSACIFHISWDGLSWVNLDGPNPSVILKLQEGPHVVSAIGYRTFSPLDITLTFLRTIPPDCPPN